MSRTTREYECAYCGERKAATDDHVPAKSFFVSPTSPLPTVKACHDCNEGASKDDEYFRDCVLKHHRIVEQPHAAQQVAAMLRAAAKPRKAGYLRSVVESFVDVRAVTKAGIDLGIQPAFRVDGVRIQRVIDRYLRGLHRYETGQRAPDGAVVRSIGNPESLTATQEPIATLLKVGTRRTIEPHVFWYAYSRVSDREGATVWLLVFFDEFPVFGYVRPP